MATNIPAEKALQETHANTLEEINKLHNEKTKTVQANPEESTSIKDADVVPNEENKINNEETVNRKGAAGITTTVNKVKKPFVSKIPIFKTKPRTSVSQSKNLNAKIFPGTILKATKITSNSRITVPLKKSASSVRTLVKPIVSTSRSQKKEDTKTKIEEKKFVASKTSKMNINVKNTTNVADLPKSDKIEEECKQKVEQSAIVLDDSTITSFGDSTDNLQVIINPTSILPIPHIPELNTVKEEKQVRLEKASAKVEIDVAENSSKDAIIVIELKKKNILSKSMDGNNEKQMDCERTDDKNLIPMGNSEKEIDVIVTASHTEENIDRKVGSNEQINQVKEMVCETTDESFKIKDENINEQKIIDVTMSANQELSDSKQEVMPVEKESIQTVQDGSRNEEKLKTEFQELESAIQEYSGVDIESTEKKEPIMIVEIIKPENSKASVSTAKAEEETNGEMQTSVSIEKELVNTESKNTNLEGESSNSNSLASGNESSNTNTETNDISEEISENFEEEESNDSEERSSNFEEESANSDEELNDSEVDENLSGEEYEEESEYIEVTCTDSEEEQDTSNLSNEMANCSDQELNTELMIQETINKIKAVLSDYESSLNEKVKPGNSSESKENSPLTGTEEIDLVSETVAEDCTSKTEKNKTLGSTSQITPEGSERERPRNSKTASANKEKKVVDNSKIEHVKDVKISAHSNEKSVVLKDADCKNTSKLKETLNSFDDSAEGPPRRFSLVESCIRQFEGKLPRERRRYSKSKLEKKNSQDNIEKSPKEEREVSKSNK